MRKRDAADDDYGTPAYSVLAGNGFGFDGKALDAAAHPPGSRPSETPDERDEDWPRERWMGVQNGVSQTGTKVPPGKGDEEAGSTERRS
jgi:hypothetical protein